MARGLDRACAGFLVTLALGAAPSRAELPSGLTLEGLVRVQGRVFDERQEGASSEGIVSAAFEPEVEWLWDDDRQRVVGHLFLREGDADDARNEVDLRELYWSFAATDWTLAVGWRRVFWGVTESVHLVDVINQSDLAEDLDGETRLGQPMVQLTLLRSWGALDLFVLPGFRERTFSSFGERLGGVVPFDDRRSTYESGAGDSHVDFAVRWSHSSGPFDIGLAHFHGTGREPRFVPDVAAPTPTLRPHYEQIAQTSLDLQATAGGTAWKLEAFLRDDALDRFYAFAVGFEHTRYDVRRSGVDVGLLFEYSWDGREDRAPQPFEDDVFFGARLGFNDVQDTAILLGAVVDRVSGAAFLNLEASRRLREDWSLRLKARAFSGVPNDDPLSGLREDDYLEVEIVRFF